MLRLLDVFILMCLGTLAVQDFRQRQISWFFIPLLWAGFIVKSYCETSKETVVKNFIFNIGFIVLQLILLTIYMSVKNKKWGSIVNSYLGLGDILFFIALAAAFSPVNFLAFYLSSICLTLIFFLVYTSIKKNASTEIPLAGAMATGMFVLITIQFFLPTLQFYNDDFFTSCLLNK